MEAHARHQTTWIFALALIILAIVGVASSRDLKKYSEDNARVLHSHEVISALDRLLVRIEQAETGQRGFLITGEDRYLSPYTVALIQTPSDLTQLERLLRDDFGRGKVENLSRLIEVKLARLERGIQVRRKEGLEAATQVVLAGGNTMREIRREVASLKQREEWRLRERSLEADQSGLVTAWLSFGGGMLALAVVALAGGLAGRSTRSMARAHGVLDMALSASGAGVWTWDVLGDAVEGSEQASRLLGMPGRPFTGTFSDLLRHIHPEDRPLLERQIQGARESRREGRYEVRALWPDGSVHWIAGSGRFFYDPSGRPVRMAGILLDIAERKRADEELRRAQGASEAAEQRAAFLSDVGAALAASLDYETTLATLARTIVPRVADYCTIFVVAEEKGEEEGEMRLAASAHRDPEKEPLLHVVAERYRHSPRNPHSLVNRALREGPLLIGEVPIETAQKITADPELLEVFRRLGPHSTMALPLAARGQVLGVLCMMTAESGRTYGEDDLEVGLELARRAALAVDNARLYREAREANASKDHFLAVLSHELRTPLTPVLAVVAGLESDGRIPDELRANVEMIRRNVELEARLIDDLLDLTRIARGKLELNRDVGDTRKVLEHAVQICCEQAIADGRLRLDIDLRAEDHRVWGDGSRLTQVLWNLLNNAVKFTPEPGEVRVSSWNEEREDGRRLLVIQVADTGIGIEPEMLPRIFNAFEQGNRNVTRRFGGIGLGLAVSKAIVELHGGTLSVASEGRGKGAAFTLRLPLAEQTWPTEQAGQAARPEVPLAAPPPASKRPLEGSPGRPAARRGEPLHILLVEDHADTALAMSDLLRVMGYRVTVAGTVGEALATAEASHGSPGDGRVDFVVSDIGLPDGTGFDLMSELSRRYGLRGIALSGYGMEDDVRRSRESGFEKHLTKPVNPQALQSVLRQVGAAG